MPLSRPQEQKKASLMDADLTSIQAYVKPAFELECLTSAHQVEASNNLFRQLRKMGIASQ
jgi:hypothetical protein